MLNLTLNIGSNAFHDPLDRHKLIDAVRKIWDKLAMGSRQARLVIKDQPHVFHGDGVEPVWLEVRGSAGCLHEVLKVANAFLPIVAVDAYEPDRGTLVSREKGGCKFHGTNWDATQA